MRCGGISPRIAQGFETGALLGDRAQQVEEIAGRACQPVKPGDNKYIAFNEYAPIRRANCLRSDRAPLIFSWKILVHFAALSSAQLRGERLPVCAYPRVPVDRHNRSHNNMHNKVALVR
jgi:hypothetical protein